MTLDEAFWRLAVALGLGLLVGMQRERASNRLAGLRTFAMFSLFGFLCGTLGGWIPAAGFLALAAVLVTGNIIEHQTSGAEPGVTTEAAALLIFGIGVHLASGSVAFSTAFGVVVAALLAFKVELHAFANRLDEADFKAAVQLALLSLVILPVLPDQTYGPYGVFNPRHVWWMVLLIAGIGMAGYLAHKLMPTAGMLVSGFIGGLVSSTATTVSHARRVVRDGLSPATAATVIAMASAVVYVRLALEIAVVAPGWLWQAGPPLLLLFAVLAATALMLWRWSRGEVAAATLSNPLQIGVALSFGAIYSAILFAVAAARDVLGDRGLYLVAAISGITDVDAISLSTAQMVQSGKLDGAVGWRVVVTATLSNVVGKAVMATALGGPKLARQLALPFGAALAVGVAILIAL